MTNLHRKLILFNMASLFCISSLAWADDMLLVDINLGLPLPGEASVDISPPEILVNTQAAFLALRLAIEK